MGWETRGAHPYYYKSVRDGTKIRKIYMGCGHVAAGVADECAAAKAKRAADQAAVADLQAKLAAVDQLAAETEHGVVLLTEASLLARGLHKHRGQ